MRTRFSNIARAAIITLILLACTASATAQDMDSLLSQLCGKTDAPARNPAQLKQAYQKALEHLLPLMGADDVASRYQHQIMLQDMGSHAARLGAGQERAALALVMLNTLQKESMPDTVRHWFVLQLQRMGQGESVPALAKLLSSQDKHLRDYARRALEMNPDPKATDALLQALARAQESNRKIGLINALGTRAQASTIKAITPALKDKDERVALTAVSALAQISGMGSAKALVALLRTRGTAYALQLKAAQALIDMGQTQARLKELRSAVWVFDTVYAWASQMAKDDSSPNPFSLRVAAINGLMECSPGADADRIDDVMQDDDPKVRATAVQAARRTLTKEPMRVLSRMLPDLDPRAQQQVLGLIRDRGDQSSVAAVLKILNSDHEAVRLSAIRTLSALGSDRSATVLLKLAVTGQGSAKKAAYQGLARMAGAYVEEVIGAQAATGDTETREVAIALLGERRAPDAGASLLDYARASNDAVRVAALKALVHVVKPSDIAVLAELLARTEGSGARKNAAGALKTALAQASDRDAAAQLIIDQMVRSDRDARLSLLSVLNAQGGALALDAVIKACRSTDSDLQDAGIRTLSNWPDYEAVTELLRLSSNTKLSVTHSVLALRGALRLIRTSESVSLDDRVAQGLYALDHARRPDDKRLAVAALGSLPSKTVAQCLLQLSQDGDLKTEAGLAAVECAGNMLSTDRQAAQDLARKIRALDISEQINRRADNVIRGRRR